MALPTLTSEQLAAASAAAARARAARADVCSRLKAGELQISQVLDMASADEILSKLKVSSMLQALPGIGTVKAQALMDRLGISNSRRLRGLGSHQLAALKQEFSGDRSAD